MFGYAPDFMFVHDHDPGDVTFVEEEKESDADFRKRIIYVAAETSTFRQALDSCTGATLDAVAEEYGLKRLNATQLAATRVKT